MSFIFHPIQYAISKTVNAVLKTPERGARISGITTPDQQEAAAQNGHTGELEPEQYAYDPDRGFKPTWRTTLKRPKNDQEAQNLYNHLRTLAWYSDSIPLLSTKLPFNIGLDAIIGFIPYVGDLFGMFVGLYLVFLAGLFGMPIRILGIMLALVIVDTAIGSVPILGDALDVAFKSNIYILHLFEHQLTQNRGKCAAGEFHVVMPPSGVWMGKVPKKSKRSTAPFPAFASQRVPAPGAATSTATPQGSLPRQRFSEIDDPPEVLPSMAGQSQRGQQSFL
jgi:hypothetical protein